MSNLQWLVPQHAPRGGKTLFLKGSVHANPKESLVLHYLSSGISVQSYSSQPILPQQKDCRQAFIFEALPEGIASFTNHNPGKMGFRGSNSLHTFAKKPRLICDSLMGKVASLIGLPFQNGNYCKDSILLPLFKREDEAALESTTVSRDKWGLHCTLFYRGIKANAALFSKGPIQICSLSRQSGMCKLYQPYNQI